MPIQSLQLKLPDGRIPELDGVRGIACLLVLVWHYLFATIPQSLTTNFAQLRWVIGGVGLSGVDLFFVLSGFLISGILFDHRKSPRYFRTFYARRICRIFPVYYLVYASLLVAIGVGLGSVSPYKDWLLKDLMPVWSYGAFVQNIFMSEHSSAGGKWVAMTWSVAVEEQFYLLFPLLAFFISRRLMLPCALLSLVICPFMRTWVQQNHHWYYTLLPCRFDALAMGIVVSCLARERGVMKFLKPRAWLVVLLMIACVSLLWMTAGTVGAQTAWQCSLVAVFYASVLLFVLLSPDSLFGKACRTSWLRKVGLISYAVYMFHQPVSGLVHGILRGQVPTLQCATDFAVVGLAAAITFLLARLSYVYMESKFLALGKKATWFDDELAMPESKSKLTQAV